MNAKHKLHQIRLQEWTSRFKEQKASGLTAKQWCEQNSISIHAYNYWKHLLKEEIVDQMLPDIAPLSLATPIQLQDSKHLPTNYATHMNCTTRANHANYTNVRFSINGVCVEIDPSVPEPFLMSLVKAVHYAQ